MSYFGSLTAQRRFVRPVPAHVADDGVHRAVVGFDDVVEVTPEQHPLAASGVAALHAQPVVLEHRRGQQPAFEAPFLHGEQPLVAQLPWTSSPRARSTA
ncbi:hypothetical protein [Actinokineospora sp.]|uniref:hypothetical protein n=1 Tax=Actinokineospora sp. TaxID=1872133 RepID=UPI003D6B7C77